MEFRKQAGAGAFAAAAGLLLALAAAPAVAEDGATPPVAVTARLADDGAAAKLSFDLSGPVAASAHAMVDPDRIVVDLAEVNFQLDPAVGRPAPGRGDAIVKAFRFGLFGPGKSRVVVDLARPACVERVETTPIAKGSPPSRLVIALKRCEPAAFAAAARASAASAPAAETSETAAAAPAVGPR